MKRLLNTQVSSYETIKVVNSSSYNVQNIPFILISLCTHLDFCDVMNTIFLNLLGTVLLFVVSGTLGLLEEILEVDSSSNSNNCSITGSLNMFHTSNETQRNETEIIAQVLIDEIKNDTNITHLKTFAVSKDWNDLQHKLKFPNISLGKQYKISGLHLDQGLFIFDFLRKFLSIIQPYDVPAGNVYFIYALKLDMHTLCIEDHIDRTYYINMMALSFLY